MRALANTKFLWLLLLLIEPAFAATDNHAVTIKNGEITTLNEGYVLNAEIEYSLSPKATEALRNGVPLLWIYRFRIEERRAYLWNKLLLEKAIVYRIQYHALLNMFRVKNESSGKTESFSTLQAALDLLSSVRDFPLIGQNELQPGVDYMVKLQIHFDRDALPMPLRPMSYLNPQWYLTSAWYTWPLKK